MKQGPAEEVGEVIPSEPMKQKPAQKNVDNAAGPRFQQRGGSGTQTHLNPAKTQANTMRYLRK